MSASPRTRPSLTGAAPGAILQSDVNLTGAILQSDVYTHPGSKSSSSSSSSMYYTYPGSLYPPVLEELYFVISPGL